MGFDIKNHREKFMSSVISIADHVGLQMLPVSAENIRTDWESLTKLQHDAAVAIMCRMQMQVEEFIRSGSEDANEWHEMLIDASLIDVNFCACLRAEIMYRYDTYSLAGHEGLMQVATWWLENVVFLAKCLSLDTENAETTLNIFQTILGEWSATEEVDAAIEQILEGE